MSPTPPPSAALRSLDPHSPAPSDMPRAPNPQPMDSDQLESAASHHHGRLTDTPSGGYSWAHALLRRGWDLSRKAALAGAAAATAPLVAPPVIIVSTAGIVLSIPFVAYLASLAGTNYLMGELLPSSTGDLGGENHVEEEFLDASEEYDQEVPSLGRWDTSEDDDAVKMENRNGHSSSLLLPRDLGVSESLAPVRGDNGNVVHQEEDGEFSLQNSGKYLLVPNNMDKEEDHTTVEENKSTEYMRQQDFVVSGSSGASSHDEENVVQRKGEIEVEVVVVQEVVEQLNSHTDLARGEVVDVQVEIVATVPSEAEVLPYSNLVAVVEPQSEVLLPSNLAAGDSPEDLVTREIADMLIDTADAMSPETEVLPVNLVACESLAVVDSTHDVNAVGIIFMEDMVRDFGDASKEHEEYHFFSIASMVSEHDGEELSSGSTPNVSATVEEMINQPNQSTGEVLGRNAIAGSKTCHTEEQLREQLDMIRTITGYGVVPLTTLEDEIAGLYIFVGVEFPAGSRDATSDRLAELNAKLQFLKSIIGVE